MGIIYNKNVEETKIMSAYGLTVYGKINVYEWTIYKNNKDENALITFRIVDKDGNDVFNMYLGNNCIFQSRVDDTLDNFLYWIATEKPDIYMIEKEVYNSLCSHNCLFNVRIENAKAKARREEEDKKRKAESQKRRIAYEKSIIQHCAEKGYFYLFDWDVVTILKAKREQGRVVLKNAESDFEKMRDCIKFIQKYPENLDAEIITQGNIEDVAISLR